MSILVCDRSIGDWAFVIDNYFGEKAGCQLWSVADSIDTRTAAGRMVLNIMMTVYQWEREVIAERTADALKYKRSRGEKTGGPVPYGFQEGPDKFNAKGERVPTLVPCEEEQQVIALMNELRQAGETMQDIADNLNARGIRRRKRGEWKRSDVFPILNRQAAA